MPVPEWVDAKATGWKHGVVTRLISLTRRAAPDATLSIKWGQPVFEQEGPFAFIKVAAAHVTFGFWRGADLADPAGLLEGGERMKHLKIREGDALDASRLTRFVQEAVRLNESGATKRAKKR